MTDCKGYDLRGSDARTEIERTKEADTPGEIPGRSCLQADRRKETRLTSGVHGTAGRKGRRRKRGGRGRGGRERKKGGGRRRKGERKGEKKKEKRRSYGGEGGKEGRRREVQRYGFTLYHIK